MVNIEKNAGPRTARAPIRIAGKSVEPKEEPIQKVKIVDDLTFNGKPCPEGIRKQVVDYYAFGYGFHFDPNAWEI